MRNTFTRILSGIISVCATLALFFIDDAQAQGSGQVKLNDVYVTYEGGPSGGGARIEGKDDQGNYWTITLTKAQVWKDSGTLEGFPYWDGEGDHPGTKKTGTFKFKGKRGDPANGFEADFDGVVSSTLAEDPLSFDELAHL